MRGVPVRAAEARNFVHDLLHGTGSQVDDLALVDALLVTTELVTNAQRHGGGLTGFTAQIVEGVWNWRSRTRASAAPPQPLGTPTPRAATAGPSYNGSPAPSTSP